MMSLVAQLTVKDIHTYLKGPFDKWDCGSWKEIMFFYDIEKIFNLLEIYSWAQCGEEVLNLSFENWLNEKL